MKKLSHEYVIFSAFPKEAVESFIRQGTFIRMKYKNNHLCIATDNKK